MRFTFKGQRIQLNGVTQPNSCAAVSFAGLHGMISRHIVQHCVQVKFSPQVAWAIGDYQEHCAVSEAMDSSVPTSVQNLLDIYSDLFQEPKQLPPSRPFDHHIDLLPGAPPVNIRPYKYSPAQKDEIEKQLAEMLSSGIIKHSTSPFASPVLLVKKKDGS